MKPMLASDYDPKKLRFPLIAQPKIDGVRALNIDGRLVGRSLKQHANRHVTELFSNPAFAGFDGEMVAGRIHDPDLCRSTTSALSRIEGEPDVTWWLFDWITPETMDLPYRERYKKLWDYLASPQMAGHNLRLISIRAVDDEEDLAATIDFHLDQGCEGTILRDPEGLHKQGRSTPREGGLLRVKQFTDAEAVVLEVEEGQTNNNEAKKNALGRTERSTHKDNMVPNGMVGRLICKDIESEQIIKVSPGRMTHDDRQHFLKYPYKILGAAIKYQHFAHGRKDKPRFGTFQGFRAASDME